MEPHEFQNLVCRILDTNNTSPNPTQHSGTDGGIDGIVKSNLMTNEFGDHSFKLKDPKVLELMLLKTLKQL